MCIVRTYMCHTEKEIPRLSLLISVIIYANFGYKRCRNMTTDTHMHKHRTKILELQRNLRHHDRSKFVSVIDT